MAQGIGPEFKPQYHQKKKKKKSIPETDFIFGKTGVSTQGLTFAK
jgi:hypothetical protein